MRLRPDLGLTPVRDPDAPCCGRRFSWPARDSAAASPAHRRFRLHLPAPGRERSSWATELEGKQELKQWLRASCASTCRSFADAVVANARRKTTLSVRGTIHLKTSPAGETCDNRSVFWGPMAWGITREYEVYEDTLMSAAFDGFLATLSGFDPTPDARAITAWS